MMITMMITTMDMDTNTISTATNISTATRRATSTNTSMVRPWQIFILCGIEKDKLDKLGYNEPLKATYFYCYNCDFFTTVNLYVMHSYHL